MSSVTGEIFTGGNKALYVILVLLLITLGLFCFLFGAAALPIFGLAQLAASHPRAGWQGSC